MEALYRLLARLRRDTTGRLRTIDIRGRNKDFCSNRISTTKYSVLTFIPRFLFDQFRRYANIFFLIISLLQQIPGISPTGRFTTALPLVGVLLAAAAKELIEDLRRYKGDNKINNRLVKVLGEKGIFTDRKWKQLRPGDIVCVSESDFIPADLIVLATSDPGGICYVQTSNLDGETNLKIRKCHPSLVQPVEDVDHESMVQNLKGNVLCESPSRDLNHFNARLTIEYREENRTNSSTKRVDADNFLLRGVQLKKTEWVYGLVVYAGHDSKMFKNSRTVPMKRSNMEHAANKLVFGLFLLLCVLALMSTIVSLVCPFLCSVPATDHWYLDLSAGVEVSVLNFIFSFMTFIILYNNLIPISLIVTVEFVKFFQAFFISKDIDLYYEKTDTPAMARNSNLNEELGQVKYVFSDKTGTLTENVMEFKKCTIDGQIYSMSPLGNLIMADDVTNVHPDTNMLNFLRVLALCHSVVPDRKGREIHYWAASPDEEALVIAASKAGVVFEERLHNSLVISVGGKREVYELLQVLEFSSERKRMSVIVKTPSGEIKLLCKGADSVVFSRVQGRNDCVEETKAHVNSFGTEGLRTLCIAETVLEPREYEEWYQYYDDACSTTDDRKNRMEEVASRIEKNLCLLGATAIEDKLQEGVPESIDALHKANIKVWVLTGDKLETAVNIGYSSRQLTEETNVELITIKDGNDLEITETINGLSGRMLQSSPEQMAIVISGEALAVVLHSKPSTDRFLKLALKCSAVICCQVTPSQKAEVVELVKKKVKGSITLAIGDGANDVSMIQAAHVGVGIIGREGQQATLASDYAIAQFRFLLKLLLVHGTWSYNRLAKVIFYSFYKNICLYIMEFWFAWYNGFSGQTLFERWTIALYNVVFTVLPPLALGLFDQNRIAEVRLNEPLLYEETQTKKPFSRKVFVKWLFLSLFHSLAVFYATKCSLYHETPLRDGQSVGLMYIGNTMYSATIVIVCLQAGLETENWTWVNHISVWLSILAWFIFLLPYCHLWPTFPVAYDMLGIDNKLYGSLMFYSIVVLVPAIVLLPHLLYKTLQWESSHLRRRQVRKVMSQLCLCGDSQKNVYGSVQESRSAFPVIENDDSSEAEY